MAEKSYQQADYTTAFNEASQSLALFEQEGQTNTDNHAAILRILQLTCFAREDFKTGLTYAAKEVFLRSTEKDLRYGEAVAQVALFHHALGDFENALSSFRHALEIVQPFYTTGALPVTELQLNIGITLYEAGNEKEAFDAFTDAFTAEFPEVTSVILQSRYYYGLLCQENAHYEKANRHFLKIKEYYDDQQETNTVDYASLMTSIGQSYHGMKNWQEAEQAYAVAQSAYETLGEKGSDYLNVVNARAINLQKMGSVQQADHLMENVSQTNMTGPDAAILLSNQAALSKTTGDLARAEALYNEALSKLDTANKNELRLFVETLQNLAVLQDEAGKYHEALQSLAKAEAHVEALPDQFIAIALKKGMVLLRAGQKAGSRKAFNTALAALHREGREYSAAWIVATNGLGAIFNTEGNLRAADSLYSDLMSRYISGVLRKDDTYPMVLNNYASVKQMQGEFSSALDLFGDATQFIRRETGVFNIAYATAIENLAYVNLNMGMLTPARPQIDSALLVFDKILGTQSPQYASALITLGRIHQNAGDYPAAEPCFRKAYSILSQIENLPVSELVRSMNALALFYQTMGNYDAAAPLFAQSLQIIEKSGGLVSADRSTTLVNLATLHQMNGRLDLATPLLEQAMQIDEKIFGADHPQYAITLKNLAVLYQKQNKLGNAQILLERALQVTENVFGKDHPSYATTISNLAALYQDQGKFREAEQAWQKSVALRHQLFGVDHPEYARSLFGLASVFFAQGDLTKANEYFQIVTGQYLLQIRENFPSMSEKEKGAFYLKIKPVFESYQDFCIQYASKNSSMPQTDSILYQLYNIQLLTKAILLNTSNKVRQGILLSGDTALINRYSRWLATKEQIVRNFTLPAEERKLYGDIGQLQQKANDLEKELSSASSLFRSQITQHEYTARDIQSALKEDEAAVEIIRIRKRFTADSVYYVALVLRKSAPAPALVIWPQGSALEDRLYRFYRNAIKFGLPDNLSYANFWSPLAGVLNGVQHVYLSSDGIFNKINLNTLHNQDNSKWVIDDFTISLVSNTKEILERNVADQSTSKEVSLYGYMDFNLNMDPPGQHATQNHTVASTRNFGFEGEIPVLPGTQKEIQEIEKLLHASNWSVSMFQRTDASERNIKKAANPKILHIATHGFFLNDMDISERDDPESGLFFNNPLLRSGLLMAGAGVSRTESDINSSEDGILTAYEAMNLTLDHTDLVVMSACETGLGEVRNGEGVYGLQRSFMVAGASAVMMSLWQVDDVATQELMVQFYSNWMAGQHKLEAFRKAQLAMKEKYDSPYYWGGFIMIGY